MNEPTPQRPIYLKGIACAACENVADKRAKCSVCRGRGEYAVTSCPRKLITPEVESFIRLASIAQRGPLPMPGGSLSQTRSFLEGLDVYIDNNAAAEIEAENAALEKD